MSVIAVQYQEAQSPMRKAQSYPSLFVYMQVDVSNALLRCALCDERGAVYMALQYGYAKIGWSVAGRSKTRENIIETVVTKSCVMLQCVYLKIGSWKPVEPGKSQGR